MKRGDGLERPLRALAFGIAALAGMAALSVSEGLEAQTDPSGAPIAPAVLTTNDIGDRMRVFATPGDFKLQNGDVTAVVRKRDGWLTELWRNNPILPSVDQLGTTINVDALWQVHPVVAVGDQRNPVMAARVSALADGIEVEGFADMMGQRYRAITVYRLHPKEPRLRMTTTVTVEGGAKSGAVTFGDAIKWDNTTYYVDDIAKPGLKYKGVGRWIGRKGAGGDLMFRAIEPEKMHIDYEGKMRGFQGAITTTFRRQGIRAGGSVSYSRELVFEPVPVQEPKAPKEVGTLRLRVSDEAGRLLPAKIKILPFGKDEQLFPDDGGLDGVDRFMWTGNGLLERELKPGRYELLVTCGNERAAARKSVDIRADKEVEVDARLPRLISTPGWISGDLHLHQAPSVDSDISLPTRVIAVAAEGVELAVATDHYVVTDLAPTVRWLRERGALAADVATIAGSEVSTLGKRFGHFNVFPLKVGTNVKSENTTPSELFADARKQSPDGILQVNHPRMDPIIGYFNYHGLDGAGNTGVPGYDPNFDTLEVYNGDEAYDLRKVKKVLGDWIHLLGKGHRYAATGSSDSHNLGFLDPGLPRTLIKWGNSSSDADDLKAPVKDIIAALKAGRAIVTSGPIIEANVLGAGPGETAQGVGKVAKLHVRVQAVPWIDVRSVEVLEGGRGNRVHWLEVKRTDKVVRFERTFDVPIERKTFLIVTVQGERRIPNAGRRGTAPFAFTNPIWVEP